MRFLTFRDKLFSLANIDARVKQLWYTHGERVRMANPTAEKKVLLCLIVKSVWRAAHEDCKLYTQVCTGGAVTREIVHASNSIPN